MWRNITGICNEESIQGLATYIATALLAPQPKKMGNMLELFLPNETEKQNFIELYFQEEEILKEVR